MAAQQTFRTAFNGFHREDVVRYIEYINSKHAAQVGQLKTEVENLRQELEQAQNVQQSEEASLQMAELEARCAALEQERDALRAQLEQPRTVEEPAVSGNLAERELEAYRRAERAERVARERAQVIYDQANGVLADATAKVDEAVVRIGEMTTQVNAQLDALQTAVTGSKQALEDAAATLYAIRPEAEE